MFAKILLRSAIFEDLPVELFLNAYPAKVSISLVFSGSITSAL
jgi:hypothetical protein